MAVTHAYRNRKGFCYSGKLSLIYPSLMAFDLSLQCFIKSLLCAGAFPGAATAKEPACQCRRCEFDPWLRGDPLEKEMATYSSILSWEILWTEEPGGYSGLTKESDTT